MNRGRDPSRSMGFQGDKPENTLTWGRNFAMQVVELGGIAKTTGQLIYVGRDRACAFATLVTVDFSNEWSVETNDFTADIQWTVGVGQSMSTLHRKLVITKASGYAQQSDVLQLPAMGLQCQIGLTGTTLVLVPKTVTFFAAAAPVFA